MKTTRVLQQLSRQERLNFLLTNRIPRRWATLFMGRFSRIEQPWIRKLSMALWQTFAGDLQLHEAQKRQFTSMHDCFVRQLCPDARPINQGPALLVSPCDGIVGACGAIRNTEVFQAKGFPYSLGELLADDALAERYRNGTFITLRLKANMYHRFHAPQSCLLQQVRYISGDTWNVNPIALKRIDRLYCRNERAVLELQLAPRNQGDEPQPLLMVAVAAILVASIRLHALPAPLDLRYRGPNLLPCQAQYQRGEEMGYFEQGSTMLVFAPAGLTLYPGICQGQQVRMGEALLTTGH